MSDDDEWDTFKKFFDNIFNGLGFGFLVGLFIFVMFGFYSGGLYYFMGVAKGRDFLIWGGGLSLYVCCIVWGSYTFFHNAKLFWEVRKKSNSG